MDTNTATILIVALFALVIIGAFLVFRGRGSAEMRGPLGWLFKVRGENPPSGRRVKIRDANAGEDFRANVDDFQGRDMRAERNIEFGDVQPPPKVEPGSEQPSPKASP